MDACLIYCLGVIGTMLARFNSSRRRAKFTFLSEQAPRRSHRHKREQAEARSAWKLTATYWEIVLMNDQYNEKVAAPYDEQAYIERT